MIVQVRFKQDIETERYGIPSRGVKTGELAWCYGTSLGLRDDKLFARAELLMVDGDSPFLLNADFDEIEYVPIKGKLYTPDLRMEIMEHMAFVADMVIKNAEGKAGMLSKLGRDLSKFIDENKPPPQK